MSIALGVPVLECVYLLGCARWAWKRCVHTGRLDSERWGLAAVEEFKTVPRMCRLVLADYEHDLNKPMYAPPGGYRIDVNCVEKRADYDYTQGRAPPYLIYVDHEAQDIVLALRGLHLGSTSDYAVLLDNRPGQELFDGGYVHHGLLESAVWVLNTETETLRNLISKHPPYTLTFTGHSLGSGVAAMLAMIVANHRGKLGGISRDKIRCYAMAPVRCMSLNLAVRYADIIYSVVLQDDFLPRTPAPLEDIFKCVCCLPCLLCFGCLRDTCMSEERMLTDPRRLYIPGRLYHIVDRKGCSCGRYPPIVKTAVPVEGRFERIVLSCNATTDHSLIWIEREAEKALKLMIKKEDALKIPGPQKMERQGTLKEGHMEEHKAALERAVSLNVPRATSLSYGTFEADRFYWEYEGKEDYVCQSGGSSVRDLEEPSQTNRKGFKGTTKWDSLLNNLLVKDDSGKLIQKNTIGNGR